MGVLKSIWERIIVAFAQPSEGKRTGGMPGDRPHGDADIDHEEAAKASDKGGWKAHGGFRK
jgi:hypothetical protein